MWGGVNRYRYNSLRGARSSMDRIRVSEALDTGSIPVGRATPSVPLCLCRSLLDLRRFQCRVKAGDILVKTLVVRRLNRLLI